MAKKKKEHIYRKNNEISVNDSQTTSRHTEWFATHIPDHFRNTLNLPTKSTIQNIINIINKECQMTDEINMLLFEYISLINLDDFNIVTSWIKDFIIKIRSYHFSEHVEMYRYCIRFVNELSEHYNTAADKFCKEPRNKKFIDYTPVYLDSTQASVMKEKLTYMASIDNSQMPDIKPENYILKLLNPYAIKYINIGTYNTILEEIKNLQNGFNLILRKTSYKNIIHLLNS